MAATTPRLVVLGSFVAMSAALSWGACAQTLPESAPAANAPVAAKLTSETGKPPAAAETPAVVVDGSTTQTLLGKPVESAAGEDMGRIVDVIVDRTGAMRAAVIDFGGFLGIGTRMIAVDWRVLHFAPGGMGKLVADLPKAQLQTAPVFKEGEPTVIVGRADAAPPGGAAAPIQPPTPPPTPSDAGTPAAKP